MNYDHLNAVYEDYLEHYGVKGMKWGVRNEEPRSGSRDPILYAAQRLQYAPIGRKMTKMQLRYGQQNTKNQNTTTKQTATQSQNFTRQFGNTDSKTVTHTGPNGNTSTRQYARAGSEAAQRIIAEHGAVDSTYYSGKYYSAVRYDSNLGAIVYVEGKQGDTIWAELVEDMQDGIVDDRPDPMYEAIKVLHTDKMEDFMSKSLKKSKSSKTTKKGLKALEKTKPSLSDVGKAALNKITGKKSSTVKQTTNKKKTKTVAKRGAR